MNTLLHIKSNCLVYNIITQHVAKININIAPCDPPLSCCPIQNHRSAIQIVLLYLAFTGISITMLSKLSMVSSGKKLAAESWSLSLFKGLADS